MSDSPRGPAMLLIVGCGNMGGAMLAGWLAGWLCPGALYRGRSGAGQAPAGVPVAARDARAQIV